MKRRWVRRASFGLGAVVLGTFLLGAVVMLLWNALMPALFGLGMVTFWQAVGLFLLSHILLRGWGPWRHGWRRDHWRRRMDEKLAAMTPEDREKFRSEWRHRCGCPPESDQPGTAPQAG